MTFRVRFEVNSRSSLDRVGMRLVYAGFEKFLRSGSLSARGGEIGAGERASVAARCYTAVCEGEKERVVVAETEGERRTKVK